MADAKPLVFVTGASGFLGSHVVYQLLESGYRVRGTARANKVQRLKEGYESYGDRFEAVVFNDIISGDITEQLKGVGAVIHVASPMWSGGPAEETLHGAIEGTLNTVRQAEKAGITKFSVISSILATLNAENSGGSRFITEDDWNPSTREDALSPTASAFTVYGISKALAEKALWEFADAHPHISVTTLCPPFFFGPFAPGFRPTPGDKGSFSTNAYIYNVLLHKNGSLDDIPGGAASVPPGTSVDVRNVARALIAGINARNDVGRKRFMITGTWFAFKDAAELIRKSRPELQDRVTVNTENLINPFGRTLQDNARVTKLLGLPDATPWQETVLDAVDSLIKLEKEWAQQGVTLA